MLRRSINQSIEGLRQLLSGTRVQRIPDAALASGSPPKAATGDLLGRMREIVSDPINIAIERHPLAGIVDESGCVVLHNGIRVPASGRGSYYGDFSRILIINRGVHEPLEEFVFQETLPVLSDRPVMLELGAYWGHYSLWLKLVRPEATTILVEPSKANLAVGRENFRRNGFEGEFIQEFVGEGHFQVDRFMADRGLAALDILHSDIQGYETEMLRGARNSFTTGKVKYAFISTHSEAIHREVVAFLADVDYRVEVDCGMDEQSTACDGFVLASSRAVRPVFENFAPLGRTQIAASKPEALIEILAGLVRNRT